MRMRFWFTSVLVASFTMIPGCSVGSALSTGIMVGKNVKSNQLGISIWLDGQEAERNELKQALAGYSRWKIKENVSTKPTLKFEFKKPDALGRISNITLSVHQKFEAAYSDHAEFTVFAADNKPSAQMKPGIDYDLGAPGEGYRVLDWESDEVDGVELKPGMQYMLTISVKADDSESAQIYFTTN